MADPTPSTFISYAREDAEFVLRLAKDLRSAGAQVWLDQLDIKPGQRWDAAVEEALRACAQQVAILSPDAVNSVSVMDEISYALEERKKVIPVLYRDCQIPFRLRRVQRADFTADYNSGLQELKRALGAEQEVRVAKAAAQPIGTTLSVQQQNRAPGTPDFHDPIPLRQERGPQVWVPATTPAEATRPISTTPKPIFNLPSPGSVPAPRKRHLAVTIILTIIAVFCVFILGVAMGASASGPHNEPTAWLVATATWLVGLYAVVRLNRWLRKPR